MTEIEVYARPPLRRILSELSEHKKLAFAAAIATIADVAFNSVAPLLLASAIAHLAKGDMTGVRDRGLILLVTTLLNIAASYWGQRSATLFAQRYMSELRGRLLDHLFSLDLDYFDRKRSGRIIARLTSDVDNLQQFLEAGVVTLLRAGLGIAITLSILLSQSVIMTGILLACVLPMAAVSAWFRPRAYTAQLAVRNNNSDLLTHITESLTAVEVVQAYGLEEQRLANLLTLNAATVQRKITVGKLNVLYQLGLDILPPLSLALVLGTGTLLIRNNLADLTVVLATSLYATRLFEPLQQLTELSSVLQSASASYAKIFHFRDEQPVVVDAPGAKHLERGRGSISLEHIGFSYGVDRPAVLHDLCLDIAPGERIALVGGSGAGKSTLAKLLARFYDPTEGRILLDGQDIRLVTQHSLHRGVAVVPQDGYLFEGTVADNIALGRPGLDRDGVELACAQLGILGRLEGLPQGLDTEVLGGGTSLSSGQRQLVALARAFVAEAPVLILDEATSHLDPATDALVEEAMAALLAGRTSITIAHRIATALHADRIVLMSNGRIVETGAPAELLAQDSAFARWVAAQEVLA